VGADNDGKLALGGEEDRGDEIGEGFSDAGGRFYAEVAAARCWGRFSYLRPPVFVASSNGVLSPKKAAVESSTM
jgi:hypothetical protein